VVVLTGASSVAGRATTREFARRGASLALPARGVDGLNAARSEEEELGATAIVLPTDMADPRAVGVAAERVEQELGPIEVWVNNAMVSVFSPVAELSADEVPSRVRARGARGKGPPRAHVRGGVGCRPAARPGPRKELRENGSNPPGDPVLLA
jgi:NADP-dependent 3-hydroxy acid dehydrogenase YdfG